MTEWVEQRIYIKFCIKLEHSSSENIQMTQKATAMGHWWLAASSRQRMAAQLMVIGRTVWGPKMPTLKEMEASLSCVQCVLYLVSSSINVYFSHYMHGYLLDRSWYMQLNSCVGEQLFLGDRTLHFVDISIKNALFRGVSLLRFRIKDSETNCFCSNPGPITLLAEWLTTLCLSFPNYSMEIEVTVPEGCWGVNELAWEKLSEQRLGHSKY